MSPVRGAPLLRSSLFGSTRTAKNSKKQPGALLFFCGRTSRQPRISAANETSFAVSFQPEQRKQREPLLGSPNVVTVKFYRSGVVQRLALNRRDLG
jgi:hypothetical protein